MDARPDILNHNLETAERLYRLARPGGRYDRALRAAGATPGRWIPTALTKSGIILGLGEEWDEVITCLRDLRRSDVNIVTLGQYLRPSASHLPVVRYYTPDEFAELHEIGMRDGIQARPGLAADAFVVSRLGAGRARRRAAGAADRRIDATTTASRPTPRARRAVRRPAPRWLRQMLLIRRFEEKAGEAYSLGKIGGFCHLYIGQEAVAWARSPRSRPDDYVVSAYREHGQALARGHRRSRAVMAELFGKATGCSQGQGRLDAPVRRVAGTSWAATASSAATFRSRAGFAFAIEVSRAATRCRVCYFGEAAANIGAFHEALNMAALWKLPAIFMIENNGYGMGTAVERAAAITDSIERAASYGMPGEEVDGQDVVAVQDAIDARRGAGARRRRDPTLLEIRTYRYVGHSMSDAAHGTYRTKEEVEELRASAIRSRCWRPGCEADGMIDDAGSRRWRPRWWPRWTTRSSSPRSRPSPTRPSCYADVLRAGGRRRDGDPRPTATR